MLNYPNIDPVALSICGFEIYWYGVLYLTGFILCFFALLLSRQRYHGNWNVNQIIDLLFYIAMGIIFGGRIGYLLFYDPGQMFQPFWSLLAIWEPGRSFHGGLIGVILALWIYCKIHNTKLLEVTDLIAPVVPIGLGLGRLGNFINAELWGRITDVPWGMIFPDAGPLPRHPSQLYQFVLEGLVLWLWLCIYSKKPRALGRISGLFLIGYGLMRFMVEFWREPDAVVGGFVALNWVTMGQVLSLPMVLLGVWLFFRKRAE